jgi:hypothetical protein
VARVVRVSWPEVWIVDPLGRLAPALGDELKRYRVAGRKVINAATLPKGAEPWPDGVIFASDDALSMVVLGYLLGRRQQTRKRGPIVWETARDISIAAFWRGKTVRTRSSAAPALAKAISYRIRRARP